MFRFIYTVHHLLSQILTFFKPITKKGTTQLRYHTNYRTRKQDCTILYKGYLKTHKMPLNTNQKPLIGLISGGEQGASNIYQSTTVSHGIRQND